MQSKAGRPKFASTRFYGFEAQTSSNWTAGDSIERGPVWLWLWKPVAVGCVIG